MKKILGVRGEQAEHVLGMLKCVATADGTLELHEIHKATLHAMSAHLFQSEIDVDQLEGTIEGAADRIVDVELRQEVMNMAGILPFLEEEHKEARVDVFARLDMPSGAVPRPGAFVEVAVPGRPHAGTARLPAAALYGDHVYVIDDEERLTDICFYGRSVPNISHIYLFNADVGVQCWFDEIKLIHSSSVENDNVVAAREAARKKASAVDSTPPTSVNL